jgi:hypothetical protein
MPGSSTAELRKFGLTVGLAFAFLGVVSWLRGHVVAPRVLWALGAALTVPGLIAPSLLGPVQRTWMALAHALGYVNTRIILSALFYLVVTPIGLMLRLFRDPLNRARSDTTETDWVRRPPQTVRRESYERQF